jgi:hypothetical protein
MKKHTIPRADPVAKFRYSKPTTISELQEDHCLSGLLLGAGAPYFGFSGWKNFLNKSGLNFAT